MRSAVCTFYEGDYHLGLGALLNSLVRAGFKGTVWVGYRGALPPWSKLSDQSSLRTFKVESVTAEFIFLDTAHHFTNCKPGFMLDILERDPALEAIFYFDPDICVKCAWSFFESWAECGVALVQEIVASNMPPDHPFRATWAAYAERAGFKVQRRLRQHFNAGFIGAHRRFAGALRTWKALLDRMPFEGLSPDSFNLAEPIDPMNVADQALLNTMAMVTPEPLSTMGPEAMDFISGGHIMSHATCSPKPWKQWCIPRAVGGIPPSLAVRQFWDCAASPIPLFSTGMLALHRLDLKIASLIGRFVRRA